MRKKIFTTTLVLLGLFIIAASFKKAAHKPDPAPLVFWTANPNYGPIEVFVDNVYQGEITSAYRSVPACASTGCVTVLITGNEWFTAQTKDGKVKWRSWQHTTLTPDACNSEQLR
jgi:hypothetical protein